MTARNKAELNAVIVDLKSAQYRLANLRNVMPVEDMMDFTGERDAMTVVESRIIVAVNELQDLSDNTKVEEEVTLQKINEALPEHVELVHDIDGYFWFFGPNTKAGEKLKWAVLTNNINRFSVQEWVGIYNHYCADDSRK